MASKTVQEPGLYQPTPVRYERQDYRKKYDNSKAYPRRVDSELSIPSGYPEPKPGDNVAVLIVDMEDKGIKYLLEEDMERLIENQIDLLNNYCRPLDIPVVEIVRGRDAKTNDKIQALIERVPRHERIEKYDNNSFKDTELDDFLKGWSVDIPIVSGINIPFCITATIDSGIERGYRMATSRDLVSKSSRSKDERPLNRLSKKCYFSENYRDLLPLFFLKE